MRTIRLINKTRVAQLISLVCCILILFFAEVSSAADPDISITPTSKNFRPSPACIGSEVKGTFTLSIPNATFKQECENFGIKKFEAITTFKDGPAEITKISINVKTDSDGEGLTFKFADSGTIPPDDPKGFEAVRDPKNKVTITGTGTINKSVPCILSITTFGKFNSAGEKGITFKVTQFEIFTSREGNSKPLAVPKREIRLPGRIVENIAIGNVERRSDLPDSVTPGGTKDVEVTFCKFKGTEITFVVVRKDAQSGNAEISKTSEGTTNTLKDSGTITVTGLTQTEKNHAEQLIIEARLANGTVVDKSAPFSCCAHPTNYRLVGIHNNVNARRYGMNVVHKWNSDSGTDLHLNQCYMKEVITKGPTKKPWTSWKLKTSGYHSGVFRIRGFTDLSLLDKHRIENKVLENPPSKPGEQKMDQRHIFYCLRCGMKRKDAVDMPANFKIVFDAKKNTKNEFIVLTTKTGNGGPVKSAIEPGQAPNAPSDVKVTLAIVGGQQVFTVTWKDESDIEENVIVEFFTRRRWRTARASPAPADSTKIEIKFPAGTYKSGETFKARVQSHNWRNNSAKIEAEVKVP